MSSKPIRLTRKQVIAQDLHQAIETLSNTIETLNAGVHDLEIQEADTVAKYEKITQEIKVTKTLKDQDVRHKILKFKISSKNQNAPFVRFASAQFPRSSGS